MNTICGDNSNIDECRSSIAKSCALNLPDYPLFPAANKYLLCNSDQNHACMCYNSGLNPVNDTHNWAGTRSSMCFDQNCALPITPGGSLTMNDILI